MHVRCVQQVVVDLVEIVNRTDEVRADVLLAVEGCQPAEYAHVCVRRELGFRGALGSLGVDPLLDVDYARAVVDRVGDVCCLGLHAADLPDERYLRDGDAVDGEAGAGVGLVALDELLDGHGAEGVVCELVGGLVSLGLSGRGGWLVVVTFEPPPWLPCCVPPMVKPPPSSLPWAPYVVFA